MRENELYQKASHWYGDFAIPNDAKYYNGGKQLPQDGFVVVYFSIVSTNGNKDYLAYNYPSDKTQWEVELGTTNSYNLPITLTDKNGAKIDSWLQIPDASKSYMGYAPVCIYQISQSTSQNYDTIGTH